MKIFYLPAKLDAKKFIGEMGMMAEILLNVHIYWILWQWNFKLKLKSGQSDVSS